MPKIVLSDNFEEYYYDNYDYEKNRYEKLKDTTLKPYYIWRENFIEDRCITKHDVFKEVLIASSPHVLLNVVLVLYIILGAVMMHEIDENVHQQGMKEAILFAYTTITTIGYGNVYPTSAEGKIACMLYCMIGIPLIFLVLSNNGQFLTEFYWIIRKSTATKEVVDTGELPIWMTGILLIVHSLIGGIIFSYWIDQMRFIPAVYFSFISIATIGYGDLVPTPENWFQIVVIICYMSVGIIILSTLLGSLSSCLKWIHSVGKPISNSKDIEVWFGGDMLTVEQLVTIVAERFGVSPIRLHAVMQDLDDILRVACDDESIADPSLMRNLSKRESYAANLVALETKSMLTTLETPQQSLSIPRTCSDSNLQNVFTARETELALQALGVLHHKLKKQAQQNGRRSQSERLSTRSESNESSPTKKNDS